MKNLILIPVFMVLAACAKGGGSDGAASGIPNHVVDSTPHDYVVSIFNPNNAVSGATIHLVCNFNLAGLRDQNTTIYTAPGSPTNSIGCAAAANVTIDLTSDGVNMGADQTYVEITIDGVGHPELEQILSAGQTYSFQRGF